ncbi:MAG: D-aminoacyl-tRNA deacylase [Candidatus Lutacidiplasmatales archaeon]
MTADYVVIVSEVDPVAQAVSSRWGTPPASGDHIGGAPVRRLAQNVLLVRRAGAHIHDERVDLRLPRTVRDERPTLVFPSIHRSERNVPCLTVHPLGNPGPNADVGGLPRTLAPTDPRRMGAALRLLDEGGRAFGFPATYEATHHGPTVELPAFFVEIGYGESTGPPEDAVRLLAEVIPRLVPDPTDRVALGVGGGHYVPHFTDLALHRRWVFGHLLSRHAIEEIDRPTAARAFDQTPGAEGVVFARAADALHPALVGVGPRLRDRDAPARGPEEARPPTSDDRSTSGT